MSRIDDILDSARNGTTWNVLQPYTYDVSEGAIKMAIQAMKDKCRLLESDDFIREVHDERMKLIKAISEFDNLMCDFRNNQKE